MVQIDPNKMFLGKLYNSENILTEENLYYNPSDLNTHCIITGMTGSGKTGLGILMLEEIALKGIPAIIIDAKGDLTNLLLHFPNMTGRDIAPWLDPEAPLRSGQELYDYANDKASAWLEGQANWGYDAEQIKLLSGVDYTVFTPGSTIGNPINIMSSFTAPESEQQQVIRLAVQASGSTVEIDSRTTTLGAEDPREIQYTLVIPDDRTYSVFVYINDVLNSQQVINQTEGDGNT